jgi:hypothetical protein
MNKQQLNKQRWIDDNIDYLRDKFLEIHQFDDYIDEKWLEFSEEQ